MHSNFSRHPLKTAIAIFFMVTLWASAYVGIRAGLKAYSPGSLALFRYLVASVCMLLLVIRVRRFRLLKFKELISVAISGILGFTIYNVALNYGEITVSAGIASFIISQIPVLITILAIFFLKEHITGMGWLGTVISFLGLVLIAIGEREGAHFDIGIIYVLIATLSGSFYSIFQKSLLKRMHPIEFTAYAIWFGTFFLLIYLPQLVKEIPHAPLYITLDVIYIGIFPAAIAYLLWSYVLSQMPTAKAISYLYLVPLVATLMGWITLGEIPTTLAIVGGLVALCGAFIVNRSAQHKIMTAKNLE